MRLKYVDTLFYKWTQNSLKTNIKSKFLKLMSKQFWNSILSQNSCDANKNSKNLL